MARQQQQQRPRGPVNDLHEAACHGAAEATIVLLSRGSINIDQGDPAGMTPLMYAAQDGRLRVAKILLNRGANLSIATDCGTTALHLSAHNGHLSVTVALVKAGADLESRNVKGDTPGHLATHRGHSEVMTALIEAGADVDSRGGKLGDTPLYVAAAEGHVDIVRDLLRAKANPMLSMTPSAGGSFVPLDAAAFNGRSLVVRELIQQCGIKGCCVGASGGVHALSVAAQNQHVDTMVMLMDAGVVDTGLALISAARWGGEAAVKLLLQQRQLAGSPGIVGYVNNRGDSGCTALFRSINSCCDAKGVPKLISHRVVRLLVDAGADTTTPAARFTNAGVFQGFSTPLAYTDKHLLEKKIGGLDLTEEQLNRLEAIRRLLLRIEAVHAVSWLWHSVVPSKPQAARATSRITRTTPASVQLTLMLPILRRRRRGALLVPLLRYSSYP